MKSKLVIVSTLFMVGGSLSSNAASFLISNIVSGPGDTLYANSDGSLMNGGLVSIGYFNSDAINPTDYASLITNLPNYVTVTSAVPGGPSVTLGGSFSGYAESPDDGLGNPTPTDIGIITGLNALVNRNIYILMSGSGGQYGLISAGFIADDANPGGPFTYSSNPINVPIVGTAVANGFVGDPAPGGPGNGDYNIVKMVPEPSAALLGSLGVLVLLRRRRN
jgi:hypothetical protein